MRLLIHSARQVVRVSCNGECYLKGESMKTVSILETDGNNGISVVVDGSGKIAAVGYDAEIQKTYSKTKFEKVIDASGMCVLPGFIDGHTHPVWAGDRVHEFAMKLAGATYMDIHKAGGGINYTVEHTRKASEEELYSLLKERLLRMLKAGTTVVECKSGYGLDTDTEVKMLRVLERAKRELPIEISSTFCGAHSVPSGMTAEEATENVIHIQLPAVQKLMGSGDLEVENIDVFCEKGVFSVEQSRKILLAGRQAGLRLNFHGDELHPTKSAELGAELGAEAVSHLEEISPDGIKAMAAANSVAVILPTTAYILRLNPPPVRTLIEKGVPVALGTDFNPNAFCLSMPLVMHLACVNLQMSLTEALIGATLNAAASLGRGKSHGSIEVGKVGDFVIVDAPRWEHVIYQMGGHDQMIRMVIKNGQVVYDRASSC